MTSKKAQATAFTILGLIMLSLVLTFVYFKAEIFDAFGEKALAEEPAIEQIKNVRDFTQDCMDEAITKGVNLLGMQGGYINLPLDDFPPSPYNILSNSLDVFGDGGFNVPYWSYLSPNSIERTQAPSMQEMEKELEEFVTQEISYCFKNYIYFEVEGYNINSTKPSVEVDIGEGAVVADILMDLDITYKETSQKFTKFKAKSEVPLGKLYSRAIELFEYESAYGFIENFTLDMMAVYDEIPYSGVDFECTPRTWLKSKVIEDLKAIMALNIPTLKIKGTDYKLRTKNDKVLVHEALEGSTKDMTVSFLFSRNWPIMIDIIGENSELLRGQPFTTENEASRFLLPLFCLNDYHFVYDIKYPVMITLTEEDYSFQFAIMAVIDNNQPKRNLVNVPQFEEAEKICDRKDTKIKVIASGISSSGTTAAMDGVDISYQCTFTDCSLGTTRPESDGYSLTTLFPQCIGGQLTASKNGYLTTSQSLDTNQGGVAMIDLEPYYSLPVQVLVNDEGILRAPYDTETILFQFENENQGYFTTYYYPSKEPLKLVGGNYKISSTLMVETVQGFNFEETEIEICSDAPKRGIGGIVGLTERKCTKQKVGPIKLDSVMAGGGSLSWNADRRVLATSNKITLYTNRGDTPQTITELNEMFENQIKLDKDLRRPTFE